ncbi:MAG: DMT family transporter [Actinomycetota bacterium]|nr:DMT family transporter [Actinomycetota bacterium]
MDAAARGRGLGPLALILASLLWGTTGTVASFMPDDVSPLAIGAATMTIGGVLLFVTSARSAIAALRDAAVRPWLLIGAVGVFAYPLAFYSSMNLAGVAVGNLVSLGSGPVFAALYEWLWERRRLSRLWLMYTLLALGGILLLALGTHREQAAGPMDAGTLVIGILLGLLAGAAYALFTYASSRAIVAGGSSRGVMGGMFGVGTIGLAPVLVIAGAPLLQSGLTIGLSAYLAIGPMFVAYLLFGIGMRSLLSSTATTITLLEPIVATVLAVVIVGERLEVYGWAGFCLVIAAVAILSLAWRKGGSKTGYLAADEDESPRVRTARLRGKRRPQP